MHILDLMWSGGRGASTGNLRFENKAYSATRYSARQQQVLFYIVSFYFSKFIFDFCASLTLNTLTTKTESCPNFLK